MRYRHYFLLLLALLLACVSSRTVAQTVAGFRASRLPENYPGGQFPGVDYWPGAAASLASRFEDAAPGGVWIVSLYQGAGVTELQFPGAARPDILFSQADSSEAYLTMLDSSGATIWLQVEPGAANVDTLIDLVLNRYRHHPCVAGFGVDVEWYQANTHANGKQVSDAEASSWESRVKAHDARYTLFLKHWLTSKMPPSYRGGILFVDDSQGFASLGAMTSEFAEWGAAFPANPVGFQYGYPADSLWWRGFADPMRSIGDALRAAIPNAAGLYWVDFTINAILPVPPSYYVSPSGDDLFPGTEAQPWRTFQYAASHATPGSTVYLKSGVYNEKISVTVSGSAAAGPIAFRRYVHDSVVVDGTGKPGDQIILIEDRSYITVAGLELRNNLNQAFGSGIWVRGAGTHITIAGNTIHDMRAAPGGGDAMAISVYGTNPSVPLSHVVIDRNHVFDCEPGHSEALTLNGNVDTFAVTSNLVHDVDNIGIDMIGGEGTSPSASTDAARNGLCAGNIVMRARSSYGGGYAAGIYVDGGKNIVLERNNVTQCDVGMEIGCENAGRAATGIVVRDNILYGNDKAGLGFGGYDYPSTGTVRASSFTNNTLFGNDALGSGTGELWIQHAESCVVMNNLILLTTRDRLMTTTGAGAGTNALDYNLWYAPAASGTVDWDGTVYGSYEAYRAGTGQDAHSVHADPLVVSAVLPAPDLRPIPGSPAIDAGDPLFSAALSETDIAGRPRVVGARVDLGAWETIVAMPGPPAAPTLVSAVAGDGVVTLTWRRNSETDFSRYRVFGGISISPTFPVDSVSSITDTTRTVAGLANNTEYFFRVTAVDLDGEESGYSAELAATPRSFEALPAPRLVGVAADSNGFRFRWERAGDASAYLFQCSAASDFSALAAADTALAETTRVVAALAESTVYYWRAAARNPAGAGPWSEVWSFSTTTGNIVVACRDKWNLLSVPALVPDPRVALLFPSAVSAAFGFHQGYAGAESVAHGEGYWMKFAGTQDVRYAGAERRADTIAVDAGWNLMGSLSAPVAAASILPVGTIIMSPLFEYNGGYAPSDSVMPGKGYWLKVSQQGSIVLDADAPASASDAPPSGPAAEWGVLTVSDAGGHRQTLYVAPGDVAGARRELPPPPPAGVFDVRFAGDAMVERAGLAPGKEVLLLLRSVEFPLKLTWNSEVLGRLTLDGPVGEPLSGGVPVEISVPVSALRLRLGESAGGAPPAAFALEQNYPNPFNAETRVAFSLRAPARVRLDIVDLLGRSVAVLADEAFDAGRHARSWNASGAASGVYFCRMTSGAATLVRALLLMR